MKRNLLIFVAGLVFLGLTVGTAAAQNDDLITAEIDRTIATTDDTLTLNVTVDATAGASDPVLPPLDGFTILGSSTSTQISIINGDINSQKVYSYYLRPIQTGDLIIGPVAVGVNGQLVETNPIQIQVSQGTGQMQPPIPQNPALPNMPGLGNLFQNLPGFAAPPGGRVNPPTGGNIPAPSGLDGQDYFVEAVVDKATPYQGEQILYTFRFYQGGSLLEQPDYQPPSFTGFWHDQQPDQTTYTAEANGQTYYVTEIQAALFPTVTGEVTIDPAVLEIPGGFFSTGGRLVTDPVTIDVQPLPENAPADFQGAVGRFSLASQVDPATSQVNDAITLAVNLSGEGNISTLPDLSWELGPEWRAFDAESENSSTFVDGRLQGSRIYNQILVPTTGGNLEIPPITYSYFNPHSATYETVSSEPITVPVTGSIAPIGQNQQPGSQTSVSASGAAAGLRPLKAAPARWNSAPITLVEQPAFWLLFLVPLALVGGYAGWQLLEANRQAGAGERRRRGAAAEAQKELKAAGNSAEPFAAIDLALRKYLAEKLGRPTVGLTHQSLAAILSASGVDAETTARVMDCLQRCESGRYIPGDSTAEAQTLIEDAEATISDLEKSWA